MRKDPSDPSRSMPDSESGRKKKYSAPHFTRLTPEEAKAVLTARGLPDSSLTSGLSGKPLAVSTAFASSGVSLVKCGALYFFFRPDSESGIDLLGSDGSFRMALCSVLNNYSLWTAREPRL